MATLCYFHKWSYSDLCTLLEWSHITIQVVKVQILYFRTLSLEKNASGTGSME